MTHAAPQLSRAGFDLKPPSPDQLRTLSAGLDDEETRVFVIDGTGAAGCGMLAGD
jgi:peptide-methionine (R)-S-oxide reductase